MAQLFRVTLTFTLMFAVIIQQACCQTPLCGTANCGLNQCCLQAPGTTTPICQDLPTTGGACTALQAQNLNGQLIYVASGCPCAATECVNNMCL